MFDGDCAYSTDVQTPPGWLHPPREENSVHRLRGVGLSPVNQIADELGRAVVIDKVGHCDGLFTLTVPSFIDRYAKTITRLPGLFYIWILLDGANDGFAADAPAGGFNIPPKKLPTIRSMFPMAES